FNPADNLQAIAATADGHARYSTDGGLSWADASGLPIAPGGVPARLAYAPGDPAMVYASIALSQGSIYKSTDGGATYSLVSDQTGYWGPGNGENGGARKIWAARPVPAPLIA